MGKPTRKRKFVRNDKRTSIGNEETEQNNSQPHITQYKENKEKKKIREET
jgi:hypothetical protein